VFIINTRPDEIVSVLRRASPVSALSTARLTLQDLPGAASVNEVRTRTAGIADLVAAHIDDKYSKGQPIRLICTRCRLKLTYMMQVCSNFH